MATISVRPAIQWLTDKLLEKQAADGSWRFCFESGILTDAHFIIALRSLRMPGEEELIHALHRRIAVRQQPNGSWTVYPDEEEGNLSATVEAYYALLYAGLSDKSDENMLRAKQFILSRGGLRNVSSLMTQSLLASTGQQSWSSFFPLPVGFMLVPPIAPVHFFEFSGYGRVHLASMMLLADKAFAVRHADTPDLSDLNGRGLFWKEVEIWVKQVASLPERVHRRAVRMAEQYMLDRIESDGMLYSYATATLPMLYALLALGYSNRHPRILQAVEGLKSYVCSTDGTLHVQNTESTVWDTALISYALQQTGLSSTASAVHSASAYLLAKQHTKLGDWSRRVRHPAAGGWGFSDSNTIHPDVDDTTAALRAIRRLAPTGAAEADAFDRGLQWVLSMQNDDGGWPAFEKNNDNPLIAGFPIENAADAAIDPSTADLTGRTLEFLGHDAGLTTRHGLVSRAVRWLYDHQEQDGSWYGRWGVCYLYGTWAALTGLAAVGAEPQSPAIEKAVRWLLAKQRPDGGWGESCASDRVKRYVPLNRSTLVQTAWAVDALLSVHDRPIAAIDRGIDFLLHNLTRADQEDYPTGAGLPGHYYTRYRSYPYIWPLLALSRYCNKYQEG